MAALWFREGAEGVSFRVHVQPRASRNRLLGLHDEALKISLTAPPVEGAANRLLRDYLAGVLGCAKSRVEVVSGHKGRRKTVQVAGLTGAELLARLALK